MHSIRTITLDLDDTLWPIGPVIERAERTLWRWLAQHYPKIPQQWDAASALRLREQVVAEHADAAHDMTFLRRTVLARMAESCGYGRDPVDAAFAVFNEQRNIVSLYPDVEPGLTRLRHGFRLIALTNGNASLEKIGIRHLFDDVITAAQAGAAKPSPRIFSAACERAGAAPEDILHVGDHPELDVDGARAVGMRTAWVNRGDGAWPDTLARPDATVRTISELADWLQPFQASRKRGAD